MPYDLPDWYRAAAVVTNPADLYNSDNGQTTVGTVATAISGAGNGRTALTVYNPSSNTDTVYIGLSDLVTSAKGYPLEPGYGLTITSNKQVYGIAAADTTIGWLDE